MTGSIASSILVKSAQLHSGEPVVYFSAVEIQEMAKPFKLALVDKFSFGHPPMDVIQFYFF